MAKQVRIQDDLYLAVNGEWLEKAVIPDDRATTGGFSDLDQGVEKLLMNDFAAFASGEKEIPEEMKEAVKLYSLAKDFKRRDEEGIKPLLPLLSAIQGIKDVKDLNEKAKEFALSGVPLPVNYGVTPDMKDAENNSFVLVGPDIILPDTTYYEEGNESGKALLGVYEGMAKSLLAFTPLSEEEQKQYLADALAFDGKIAKTVKSQVEWADYVNNYNPMSLDEVASEVAPFDIKGFLAQIYGANAPTRLIVYDPKAIKGFSTFFNEENFPLYVHWAYVKCLVAASTLLSAEMKQIGSTYNRALTGTAKEPIPEKWAYRMASRFYSEPVGVYYGRTYFGEEAKKDVVSLVKKIIETYKKRMEKNAFLEEATKKKAILKLSTIAIKMGYPDRIDPLYEKLTIDPKKSLFENVASLNEKMSQDNLDKLPKKVDRGEWGMPGHMVNACYNPFANDITFPAAILQKPFYSLEQSESENLGGIGAVIGHEISHAFDNNGAHFDEKGNLADWWSEKDFAAFKALTQRMIEEFDGIPFHGGKVNGTLVVSENIADNGGMGVTLGIMHTLKNPDFKAYFINWARVWCQKAKEEYIRLRLSNDVHSPAPLRANMQPRNFDEWYEAFGVSEKDGMYLPPEKRVRIW